MKMKQPTTCLELEGETMEAAWKRSREQGGESWEAQGEETLVDMAEGRQGGWREGCF